MLTTVLVHNAVFATSCFIKCWNSLQIFTFKGWCSVKFEIQHNE